MMDQTTCQLTNTRCRVACPWRKSFRYNHHISLCQMWEIPTEVSIWNARMRGIMPWVEESGKHKCYCFLKIFKNCDKKADNNIQYGVDEILDRPPWDTRVHKEWSNLQESTLDYSFCPSYDTQVQRNRLTPRLRDSTQNVQYRNL